MKVCCHTIYKRKTFYYFCPWLLGPITVGLRSTAAAFAFSPCSDHPLGRDFRGGICFLRSDLVTLKLPQQIGSKNMEVLIYHVRPVNLEF